MTIKLRNKTKSALNQDTYICMFIPSDRESRNLRGKKKKLGHVGKDEILDVFEDYYQYQTFNTNIIDDLRCRAPILNFIN